MSTPTTTEPSAVLSASAVHTASIAKQQAEPPRSPKGPAR
jgi:hypothetical protein